MLKLHGRFRRIDLGEFVLYSLPLGGKKCPTCKNRIFHEKWKITPQLAEARWAHQEARNRELAEVVDFMD